MNRKLTPPECVYVCSVFEEGVDRVLVRTDFQSPPKGPENWCRAEVVEKGQQLFWTLFHDF